MTSPIVSSDPFLMIQDPIVNVVAKWFAVMADRFGRTLDPVTVNGYIWAMKRADLTQDEVEVACRFQFLSAKFWPSPGEIVNEALAYRARERERLPKIPESTSGRPWLMPKLDGTSEREKVCQCGATFRQSRFDRDYWAALDPAGRRLLKKAFPDGYCPDACRSCIDKETREAASV